MDSFLNVKIYKKEKIEQGSYEGKNFLFFSDDKERDWYETRKTWRGCIGVDPLTNIVCAFQTDVTMMTMVPGQNVYEVEYTSVPENVIGNFQYSLGVFKEYTPIVSERTKEDILYDLNRIKEELDNMV
ncbi:hypothetical protein [Pantoea sp. CCBC3-3-1]|uniref:hypothetical protein n=1 Tax=Pantoea sp. CCBC3-3-1 TaxID=2490851 RepID=UPI0011BD8625|nr:hypothetical protein [Pantoea sp. CCBC3-3-1]